MFSLVAITILVGVSIIALVHYVSALYLREFKTLVPAQAEPEEDKRGQYDIVTGGEEPRKPIRFVGVFMGALLAAAITWILSAYLFK
jgi:hypothetical protein